MNFVPSIESDLKGINSINFPRKAYSENISLVIFTDASKTTYGFSCYCRCVDENKVVTNLLLSKCKNAPTKSKSVPTLELLAVFMAFKCPPSILSGLARKNVHIYIGVDAQIVL